MAWPSESDFSEAVQNPRIAFRDAELENGEPELNNLGLPKARSGGFAVVFKLQCGLKNWAVKCFTRDFPDRRQRYVAISDYLAQKRLPYTVGFDFLTEGIRVRGHMYPILKMEWVEGENLREYVERHLSQPEALRALADRWVNMIKMLHAASIVHGDLQDANIIIVQDEIQLIDYDGIFVPELTGYGSHEVGARHYQHPLRTGRDFGSYLDNFSAWVVYLSLLALAAQPDLWRRFGGEVERLILRREDYEHSDNSPVLRALENSPDRQVRLAAKLFESLLYSRLEEIPFLDGQVVEVPAPESRTGRPGWLDDYVPQNRTSGHDGEEPLAPNEAATADPSWIIEGISQEESVRGGVSFEHSPVAERTSVAGSVGGVAIVVVLWHLGFLGYYPVAAAAVFGAVFNALLLTVRYLSENSVEAARRIAGQVKRFASVARGKEGELEEALREAENIRRAFKVQEVTIGKKRENIHRQGDKEVSELQASSVPRLQSINSRRLAADKQSADELAKLRGTLGRKSSVLDRQISELDSAENQELANALQDLQSRHMQSFLSRFAILASEIPPVGPSFRLRLAANGFRTAADIDARVITVPGIGPVRATALQAWKGALQARARTTAPPGIPPNEEAAIRTKYRSRRSALKSEKDNCQRQLANEERTVRAKSEASRDTLAKEEETLRSEMTDKEAEIRSLWRQQAAILDDEEKKAQQRCDEDVRKNSDQITQLRKELFRTNWEAVKLDRQMEAFRNIRFGRYLARVFGLL